MSGTDSSRRSKNERREVAREKAKAMRAQQERKERRTRLGLQLGIGIGLIAVIAVVALVIVNSVRPPAGGPRNMASDGLTIGAGLKATRTEALSAGATPQPAPTTPGVVQIVTYEDFMCSACGAFEKTNRDQIQTLVKSGKATLEIKPVAILDRLSQGTKYSTRAANAFACVADYSPDRAFAFHRLLYANQPAEDTTGLADAKLISYAKQAGVGQVSAISKCIANQAFADWVGAATDRFTTQYSSTPTVLVNGKQYSGSITDPAAFATFVLESGATYTGTPTPSATASPSASN